MKAIQFLRELDPYQQGISYSAALEIIDMAHQEALELIKEQLIKEGIDNLIKQLK